MVQSITLTNRVIRRRTTPKIPKAFRDRLICPANEVRDRSLKRGSVSAWSAIIRYCDKDGMESTRRITLKSVHKVDDDVRLNCFCHERWMIRSFYLSRILDMACIETGELLDPAETMNDLVEQGIVSFADERLQDVIKTMMFLSSCDGEYHPLEADAVITALERYLLRFGGDDRVLDEARLQCSRLAPDGRDVVKALQRFAQSRDGPAISRFVLRNGADVIDADGRHREEEIRWAVEISDTLKAIATQ